MLVLQNGDYKMNGGVLCQAVRNERVLQRILFKLTARRGQFPFGEERGSRLWELGKIPSAARQSAAAQYVTQALEDETNLTVENVVLTSMGEESALTVDLLYDGESLSTTLHIR